MDEDGETLSQAEQDNEDNADSRREFALALLNHVMEKLDEFVRSNSYRGRLMYVYIFNVPLWTRWWIRSILISTFLKSDTFFLDKKNYQICTNLQSSFGSWNMCC